MKKQLIQTPILLFTTLTSQIFPLYLHPPSSPTLAQTTATSCANPGRDTTPLNGIINTYYPGTNNISPGIPNTTINLGTRRGANIDIQAGDLLVIMQMQGTNAGNYEYAVAEQFNGTSVIVRGTGTNGGLNNSYINAPATPTQGQQTFQVIRVPQYLNANLTGIVTAAPWDGTTGGVVVADVARELNFTGSINVSGQGFRGGRGLRLGGRVDWRTNPPTPLDPLPPGVEADYTGVNAPSPTIANINAGVGASGLNGIGANGSKGEGIGGTPRYTFNGDLTAPLPVIEPPEGYPGGSFGRGAVGNAGGGATDGDPFGTNLATIAISRGYNAENSGGGGGGNAGAGGQGGFSWRSKEDVGGRGGNGFTATSSRVILGGGGGAGSNNDGATASNGIASSGGTGGGIVLIRAGNIIGNGTVNATGANAPNSRLETTTLNVNDGGGGGGAGGSVVISAVNSTGSNLNINAQGGEGGDVRTRVPHGPGGGGGGGVVLTRNVGQTLNLQGGISGTFINTGDDASETPDIIGDQGTYGATNGSDGVAGNISSITGILSGAECLVAPEPPPQPLIYKSVRLLNDNDNSGNITVGDDLQYTLTIINPSTTLPVNGMAIADRVPSQLQVIRNSILFPTGFNAASSLPNGNFNGTNQYIPFTNPGNLPINTTLTLTYTARILPDATGQIANQAGIDLTPTDPNPIPEILSDASDSLNPTQPGSGNNPGNVIDRNGNINQITGNGVIPDITTVNIQTLPPNPEPPPPGIVNLYGVKRITNVRRNGVPITEINFNTFVDDPNDVNDNMGGWSQFLPIGVPTISNEYPLQSGDEVEYTIYYLVEGNQPINNARFCDPIPVGTTFIPNSFGSGRGIGVNMANNMTNPTNIADADNASFFSPVAPLPPGNVCPNQTNPTGAVIVNLGNLDNNQGNNFGFVRFWVRVD